MEFGLRNVKAALDGFRVLEAGLDGALHLHISICTRCFLGLEQLALELLVFHLLFP